MVVTRGRSSSRGNSSSGRDDGQRSLVVVIVAIVRDFEGRVGKPTMVLVVCVLVVTKGRGDGQESLVMVRGLQEGQGFSWQVGW